MFVYQSAKIRIIFQLANELIGNLASIGGRKKKVKNHIG